MRSVVGPQRLDDQFAVLVDGVAVATELFHLSDEFSAGGIPGVRHHRRRVQHYPLGTREVNDYADALAFAYPASLKVAIHQARRRDVKSAGVAVLSGGFEAGRKPGVAAEEVAEGVEFADAPFRGG